MTIVTIRIHRRRLSFVSLPSNCVWMPSIRLARLDTAAVRLRSRTAIGRTLRGLLVRLVGTRRVSLGDYGGATPDPLRAMGGQVWLSGEWNNPMTDGTTPTWQTWNWS